MVFLWIKYKIKNFLKTSAEWPPSGSLSENVHAPPYEYSTVMCGGGGAEAAAEAAMRTMRCVRATRSQ